jgi:hypothetical protein
VIILKRGDFCGGWEMALKEGIGIKKEKARIRLSLVFSSFNIFSKIIYHLPQKSPLFRIIT